MILKDSNADWLESHCNHEKDAGGFRVLSLVLPVGSGLMPDFCHRPQNHSQAVCWWKKFGRGEVGKYHVSDNFRSCV